MRSILGHCLTAIVLASTFASGQATDKRMVLVELYTSQGCDMCPTAEEILGQAAKTSDRIVPIAFHIDYFNQPWIDPFSDKLYSQRQLAYNGLYHKPKNADYGIYYTPMLMVDGEQSVNGRDKPGLLSTVRAMAEQKPQVGITATLVRKPDGRSGEAQVKITNRSAEVDGREVLIAAVLREDGVVTKVPSGENAGKTLTSRFAARRSKYVTKTLGTGKTATLASFSIEVEPSWDPSKLRLAVFVQDTKTGVIYQASDQAWQPSTTATKAAP